MVLWNLLWDLGSSAGHTAFVTLPVYALLVCNSHESIFLRCMCNVIIFQLEDLSLWIEVIRGQVLGDTFMKCAFIFTFSSFFLWCPLYECTPIFLLDPMHFFIPSAELALVTVVESPCLIYNHTPALTFQEDSGYQFKSQKKKPPIPLHFSK